MPQPARTPTLLEQADAAWEDGDREAARRLYTAALARDTSASRAVFRLAQLAPDATAALPLYRRYVSLQPRDPWGHMALGDALGRLRRYGPALDAYRHAASLAPAERDVVVGRARWEERADRPDVAMHDLEAWTSGHATDGEAWDLLGRAALRAGRPRTASDAFTRANAAGIAGAAARASHAAALATPAVEPIAGYQRDSDGNRSMRAGGIADVMVTDGMRLGVSGAALSIGDGMISAKGAEGAVRLSARPTALVRVDLQGGALQLASLVPGGPAWRTPQADVRLRVRAPLGGPSLDLRAQRMALGAAPVLVEHHVVRTEARATLEVPAGPVRVRTSGRAGQLHALGEAPNGRLGAEGAIVLPLGSAVQLSGQYRWLGYQRASAAGYFAPRRAETAEGGLYVEHDGEGPVSVAADLGGGVQRVARQGETPGGWTRSLRAWGYAGIALAPARALYAELEAYDAPFAPNGAATSGSWRFVSLSLGMRWGF